MSPHQPTQDEINAIHKAGGWRGCRRGAVIGLEIYLINELFSLMMAKANGMLELQLSLGYILNVPHWFYAAMVMQAGMTMFLGAGIGYMVGQWRADRKLKRYQNGKCIKCGYDLRSSDNQCPECGSFQSVLLKKLQW
jgi:DNA-directed RNA polymerase subunit RPC12/RpoP